MKRACQAELDRAKALRAQGLGYHEVAKEIGRSDYSIRLWEKNGWKVGVNARPNPEGDHRVAEAPQIAEAPVPGPPDSPEAAKGLDDGDELARVLQLQNEQFAFARESRKLGNMTAAQRAMRDASSLAPVIARLRKARAEGADGTTITSAQLAAARKSFYDKLAILTAQPIYCAHCGRALRIATAETDVSADTAGG